MKYLLLLALLAPGLLFADKGFTVSSTSLPPSEEENTQNSMIARLKHQAVVDFLQLQMGSRYAQHEALVTPEFTEHFVLDYKVIRQPGTKGQIDLSGHLDTDALKRWVRITEAKGGGGMKPLFILSSQISEMPVTPRETAAKVREGALGPTLFSMLSTVLQKFGARLSTLGGDLGLQLPPRREADFRTLRDFALPHGFNTAVWVNLSACRGCGTKVDIYFIQIPQGRLVMAKSEDVAFEAKDFSSGERIRKELKEPLKNFSTEFEELVSSGTLFSSPYRVTVENLDGYRAYKQIDAAFAKLDYVVQSSLKRSEAQTAEFQLLTNLSAEELYARLQMGNFPGFALKPVRQEAQTLVLRYSK